MLKKSSEKNFWWLNDWVYWIRLEILFIVHAIVCSAKIVPNYLTCSNFDQRFFLTFYRLFRPEKSWQLHDFLTSFDRHLKGLHFDTNCIEIDETLAEIQRVEGSNLSKIFSDTTLNGHRWTMAEPNWMGLVSIDWWHISLHFQCCEISLIIGKFYSTGILL
jgi:hypothetical protein